jgi:exodeoxyribonuclease VII small subunit
MSITTAGNICRGADVSSESSTPRNLTRESIRAETAFRPLCQVALRGSDPEPPTKNHCSRPIPNYSVPPRKTSAVATPGSNGELANFETEFGRLGSIVERLESGNLPLEEMLKLYEEGMTLSQKLNTTLSTAELQVKKLSLVHEEMTSGVIEDVHEEVQELEEELEEADDEDPF